MFYVRADGNFDIGMGHVMRCLSIADAMTKAGTKPIFVTATEECVDIIKQRGYEVEVLDTDYQEMELELRQFAKILKREPHRDQNTVLVDSYQVTEPYFIKLRDYAKVVCMEDMGYPYPVDMLINYNIYGDELEYYGDYKKLLGTTYMPLRAEFQDMDTITVKDEVTNVMLTTGGSDPQFISKAILQKLLSEDELSKIHYHVISGPFNHFKDELINFSKDYPQITVYENVKSMKEIMLKCDVAITATGSTLYEISSLGLPMICFYFAENQQQGARCLAERTEIVNAGNITEFRERTLGNITKTLQKCVSQKEYRETLSAQEKELVDGKGAMRIAEEIIAL